MMTTRLVRVIVASVLAATVVVVGAAEPAGSQTEAEIDQLVHCESGGHGLYTTNTGNGYYGAGQFLISTWNSIAGWAGRPDLVGVRPDLASPADQRAMIRALYARSGRGQWPSCGRFLVSAPSLAAAPAPAFVAPAVPLPRGNLDLAWTVEGSPGIYAAGWCDGDQVHVYVDGVLERATQSTGPRPDVGPGSTAGWRILTLAAPGAHHVQAWCIGPGGANDLGEWHVSVPAPDRVIVGVRQRGVSFPP